jgi:RNA polymerase sigma-70 factor, ECF subfamily
MQMHAFLNAYREKSARAVSTSRPVPGMPSLVAPCPPDQCNEQAAEQRALAGLPTEQIRAALTALPDELHQALYLVDLAGLSYREAGAVMGIPRRTVLSRVHRGRCSLLSRLAQVRG